MSTTYNDVLGLRVVRNYLPDPIADPEIEAILEAARWTGSSKNRQDWAFIIVTATEGRERVASAGGFTDPVRNAPLVVALVWPDTGYEFDIGRVAQNMMLAAAALGIGSCPVTLHDEDRAREALGVPADHRCRYAVAFGYPDEAAENRQREERRKGGWGGRKPPAELVHRNGFGG
jgi:nitroreductase